MPESRQPCRLTAGCLCILFEKSQILSVRFLALMVGQKYALITQLNFLLVLAGVGVHQDC